MDADNVVLIFEPQRLLNELRPFLAAWNRAVEPAHGHLATVGAARLLEGIGVDPGPVYEDIPTLSSAPRPGIFDEEDLVGGLIRETGNILRLHGHRPSQTVSDAGLLLQGAGMVLSACTAPAVR